MRNCMFATRKLWSLTAISHPAPAPTPRAKLVNKSTIQQVQAHTLTRTHGHKQIQTQREKETQTHSFLDSNVSNETTETFHFTVKICICQIETVICSTFKCSSSYLYYVHRQWNMHKSREGLVDSYEPHQWQTQKATVCNEYLIALQNIPSACYEFQNDDCVIFYWWKLLQKILCILQFSTQLAKAS